eukprot:scaffold318168_cov23-Prasinocladus_malaysianus.AAC.1
MSGFEQLAGRKLLASELTCWSGQRAAHKSRFKQTMRVCLDSYLPHDEASRSSPFDDLRHEAAPAP